MHTPYDVQPSASCILGDSVDNWGEQFAKKLGRRVSQHLYVSCNLADKDPQLQTAVEGRIVKELKALSLWNT